VKIQGWFVERFGALRNYEVRDLPDGLTVFCGPNGAGKSTLVAFLRQMLFGSTQPADKRFVVPQHDRWAGRLHLAGPGGVYTITRTADHPGQIRVARPDGGEGDENELERVFGGADCRSLASLLAFNIDDLQALPSLPAHVRERLLPAGADRGLRSVQRALDAIQARKSEIAQRASRDLQRLPTTPAELQSRIDRSTRAAGRLCQLLQAQAQARLTLDLRTRSISDLKADAARYEALVDLAPLWQELTQARRDLENTEFVEEIPADFEQRLDHALTARDAAQRTVAQLFGQDRSGRRDGSAPDEAAGASTIVRQRVRLPEPNAATSEDLSAWQRRLQEAVEAARDSERELETTARTVRELELARNEITTTLSRTEPPNVATLDEEARLVQHVRTILAALAADQTSTKRLQDQIAERTTTVRDLETQVVSIPSSLISHAAWVVALLGIVAAVWQYTQHDVVALAALIGFSLVSAAGSTWQRSRRSRALEEDAMRRTQLAGARIELERACQSLLHHQERAARRRFDISVDSVRLGLPPMPSDLQLREREAELEAQRRQRTEWDKAQEALAENQSALTRNKELRRQQAQAVLAAQTHERQTIQQWHQWKVHAGLTESGGAVRGAGGAVPTEAELLENCRRLRIQIAEWEQNATDWNSRARAALVGAPDSETAVSSTGTGVMVAPPETEHWPALQAARRRVRQCEDALTQIFAHAGVSDEIAFRARIATSRRRAALTQTIRACETRYNDRLRREPAADALVRELSDGRIDEWRHRADQSLAELTSLEASRDEALRQLRQLEADISGASAESSDLPVLEAERAGLTAEASASLTAARTLAIAGSLLEDARRQAERESQPPALRRASEAFSAITFSRYERLGPSDDQRELVAFEARNGWKTVTQLSRGTTEQLYFSLRVGLAEESAQCGPWLPLVLDDVLDHFDPKRSQAMARQLVDLSRRHQIFVFTRRPETRDLLRSLDPAAHVINMQEL